MLRVRHQLATFEGVVNAAFVCPACGHRAGVLTQVTGTGNSSAILLHDLAQKESQENAERRALDLAELFAKAVPCPACSHRPRSPLALVLAAEGGDIARTVLLSLLWFPLMVIPCLIAADWLRERGGLPFEVGMCMLAVAVVGAWVGILFGATWELRAVYRRMKDPPVDSFMFTEPPPPRPREPTAWDLWRGVR